MRPVSILALFASAALFSATAADEVKPPEGWKESKGGYKNDAFIIWLPSDGKVDDKMSSVMTKNGQIRIYRLMSAGKDGSVFGASQIILPPALNTVTIKDRQDLLRDLFVDEVKGKLLEEKKVTATNLTGKEYLVETPDGLARMRLLNSGIQIFRVVAVGSKEQLKAKEVDAFFDSFKHTPKNTKIDEKKDEKKDK
ncbi:MAG: hypothetical protein K8U57_16000 [Planctomycetes bacterium]|nr:hypothetical protein [Planctomycetota bacterium]